LEDLGVDGKFKIDMKVIGWEVVEWITWLRIAGGGTSVHKRRGILDSAPCS
jgi:hypothetical protein